jgi:hypothetical protein
MLQFKLTHATATILTAEAKSQSTSARDTLKDLLQSPSTPRHQQIYDQLTRDGIGEPLPQTFELDINPRAPEDEPLLHYELGTDFSAVVAAYLLVHHSSLVMAAHVEADPLESFPVQCGLAMPAMLRARIPSRRGALSDFMIKALDYALHDGAEDLARVLSASPAHVWGAEVQVNVRAPLHVANRWTAAANERGVSLRRLSSVAAVKYAALVGRMTPTEAEGAIGCTVYPAQSAADGLYDNEE